MVAVHVAPIKVHFWSHPLTHYTLGERLPQPDSNTHMFPRTVVLLYIHTSCQIPQHPLQHQSLEHVPMIINSVHLTFTLESEVPQPAGTAI
jgi:hypothetical protein